jgi:general L-amino acid transport system substrate-binding protein
MGESLARRVRRLLFVSAVLCVGVAAPALAGPTIDGIKSRGLVSCGMTPSTVGFGMPDSTGKYHGINVDLCRALASAILNQPDAIKIVPLSAQARFTAIQSGEVDVLLANATWTLGREGSLGLLFAPTIFYDGQGFLVPKRLGITSAKQLGGATVCVQQGTTTELNLADFARSNNLDIKTLVVESVNEVENALFSGRCDAYTNDATSLGGTRLLKAPKPDDWVVLPDRISKEPLAPAVRQGDDQFFNVVRWSVFVLLDAEEKGITRTNVEEALKSTDPAIKRLVGVTPGNGKALGIDEDWAFRLIKTVGNYGEIFDRHLGKESALKFERGINELWTKGGLMYAPPAR